MIIEKSCISDLSAHMELYHKAIAFQRSVGNANWIGFDDQAVLKEIESELQYKIVIDGKIACVFLLTTSDPIIWKEKDADPAIYIHRIATNPDFRGQNFVQKIIDFVKDLAIKEHKTFIRMDTTAGNDRLNDYYKKCGFTIVDTISIQGTADMPTHYQNNLFTLFEMNV